MTYVNAELESTTLEIEIDASEIVAEAECEIETIVDDVISSNDLISREQAVVGAIPPGATRPGQRTTNRRTHSQERKQPRCETQHSSGQTVRSSRSR